MMELRREGETFQKEYDELKIQGPSITETVKLQVIREYEESPELTEKIILQLSEGYQDHKDKIRAKMLAASLDTKILESSNEESEGEKITLHPTTNI